MYMRQVPFTDDDVLFDPPESWIEPCAREGMCDAHLDLACSRLFLEAPYLDSLPTLYSFCLKNRLILS